MQNCTRPLAAHSLRLSAIPATKKRIGERSALLGSEAAGLLHGHINEVLIFKSKLLRSVVRGNALTINHEANLRGLETEATAVGVHQLPQGCRFLDLELDLTALLILDLKLDVGSCGILCHLEPEVQREGKLSCEKPLT